MEKMVIRQQTLKEMEEIYRGRLAEDFPADEIKPFSCIKEWYEQGNYVGYGLYEDPEMGECLGYAWLCRIPEEKWVLLDYYAMKKELRGEGKGSRFLKRIFEECTEGCPVIIEVEDPDWSDCNQGILPEKEKEKRLRRISFYLKNGVQETELRACVFQVHYSIMVYLNRNSHGESREKDAQNVVSFDPESLKRAYYLFYSHAVGKVEIGEMHKNERL